MKLIQLICIGLSALFLSSCATMIEPSHTTRSTGMKLSQDTTWQIQYSGEINPDIKVEMFNLDLFDIPPEKINKMHQNDIFVMCYFSAGSYEDWRPDSSQFPKIILGKDLGDWPDELWLDIRRLDLLGPILEKRLDMAVVKGCDGVDPDNIDGYQNDTGFNLTPGDQLVFNKFLSQSAHDRGLLIGLKNDLDQAAELVSYFDWIITEECFFYNECDLLTPFLDNGKPVFLIEYELTPAEFCPEAKQMGINALQKNLELDAFRFECQ